MTETVPEPSGGDWFTRNRVLVVIAVVIAIIGVVLAFTVPRGDDSTLASQDADPAATSEGGPTDEFPIIDGDWRLDSFQADASGSNGSFGGHGRVTYIGDMPEGGTGDLRVTIFKDGQQVGVVGMVTKFLKPGMSEDMWFFSLDDRYVAGPYTYEFEGPEPYVEPDPSMTYPPG